MSLVYSGLVRNGPGGSIVADLAERWTVDPTGAIWTFELRPDARWHDGEPVTADDVAFTIRVFQDPAYTGPAAGSWNEVKVSTEGPTTVVFTLTTPLGGFLQAATQPIAPAHLLGDVPVDELSSHPFGRQPIGSGPFAVASLSDASASLIPAVNLFAPPVTADATAGPTDSLATAPPVGSPEPAGAVPVGDRVHLLRHAWIAGHGLSRRRHRRGLGTPGRARTGPGDASGSRTLRYPGATMTAVLLNLRPGHPEFADPAVRTALLQAIDRPRLIGDAFAMAAAPAIGPIPPSSVLLDPAADAPVPHDLPAAKAALIKAGWTTAADGWHLPKSTTPLTVELLSPDAASNPAALAAAEAVARDWRALGIIVDHISLPAGEFVTERLKTGKFQAAVADVTVGLDPDLYPLLASSQTVTGGSNVIGLQDLALDALLVAARGPGPDEVRRTAYSALQRQLAKGRYLLPLAFADESVVVRDTFAGPSIRQVADPADRFWDVLTWRLAAGR